MKARRTLAGLSYGTDFADLDLRGADLRGADLSRANGRKLDVLGASYDDETKWPEGYSLPYEGPIKRSEIDAVEFAETVEFLEESCLQVRVFYYAKFDFPTITVNRADQRWFRYVAVEGQEDWECGFELFHRDGYEYHSQKSHIGKCKSESLLEAVREAPSVIAAGNVHNVQWVRRYQRDPLSRGYDMLFRSLCGEQIQFEGDD